HHEVPGELLLDIEVPALCVRNFQVGTAKLNAGAEVGIDAEGASGGPEKRSHGGRERIRQGERRGDVGGRVEGIRSGRRIAVGLGRVVVVERIDEDANAGAEDRLSIEYGRRKGEA